MSKKIDKPAKILFALFWGVIIIAIIGFEYLDTLPFRYTVSNKGSLRPGMAIKGGNDITYEFVVNGQLYQTTNRINTEQAREISSSSQYLVRFSSIFPEYSELLIQYPILNNGPGSPPPSGCKENPFKD
ncbi:hypothetical protein OO013_19920 [Mangrovivirga sp. M17]|uniref:Uncharacterized protein n=1 Tax=Mangrovivirga halotolerans TaxID=2993936 RepID=A0ABT3RX56_9BACT|nr:hypothetical protein [Mangrovivirga halotolerans]MCX2746157.1 hypothetical protein [Mangrovivirga halotolerans]